MEHSSYCPNGISQQGSSLMTGGAKRGVPNPWLFEEPEETRGLGFDEIRQQQQKIIQEQDAGLDALSSIISRQKQMGQEIGNELEEQNDSSVHTQITVTVQRGPQPCSQHLQIHEQ
ncbi:Syntaxin-8 [Myotis davidii]|uniref:Syntaxin-8 n=1 Tax=Myotis davidii TaxID=225400 RepID=L5LZH8_MYODS|nr:Syntaxin-8 [Myotis davidii]